MWQLQHKVQEKVSYYSLYTSPKGNPLRLYMMGFNILAGSHFDEYLLDFMSFKAGKPKAEVFDVPDICSKKPQPASAQSSDRPQQATAATATQRTTTTSVKQAGSDANGAARPVHAAAVMPWGRIGMSVKQ